MADAFPSDAKYVYHPFALNLRIILSAHYEYGAVAARAEGLISLQSPPGATD
jgi:hypothetical protein